MQALYQLSYSPSGAPGPPGRRAPASVKEPSQLLPAAPASTERSGAGPDTTAGPAPGTGSGSVPTLCSSSRHRPERWPRSDHEQLASGPITRSVSGSPSSRDNPSPIAAPWLTTTASDPPGKLSAIRSNASPALSATAAVASPCGGDQIWYSSG